MLGQKLSRPTGKRRAQALVEFALTLMIFLLALVMVFEVARILQAYITVQHAARMAVRYAITGNNDTQYTDELGGWVYGSDDPLELIPPCRARFDDDMDFPTLSAIQFYEPYRDARTCSVEAVAIQQMRAGLFLNTDAFVNHLTTEPGYYEVAVFGMSDNPYPDEVGGMGGIGSHYIPPEPNFVEDEVFSNWFEKCEPGLSDPDCIASSDPAVQPEGGYKERGMALVRGFAGQPGQQVVVRIIYRVPIVTPLLSSIAKSVQIGGTSTMTNESFGNTGLQPRARQPPELQEIPELDAPPPPPAETDTPEPTTTGTPPPTADVPNGEVVLIYPDNGDILTVPNVTFVWRDINYNQAVWYRVAAVYPDGTTIAYFTWVEAARACSGGECRIPKDGYHGTAAEPPILENGDYSWWVLPLASKSAPVGDPAYSWVTRIVSGWPFGSWWGPKNFTIATPKLGKTILIEPEGTINNHHPVFRWQEHTTPLATWYRLWAGSGGVALINQWYKATDICTAGICEVTSPVYIPNGTYQWYVRNWSETDDGIWSDGMTFVNDLSPTDVPPAPDAVTQISPQEVINTTQPTYIWNESTYATWYLLWVGDAQTGKELFKQWYEATNVCLSGICSVKPSFFLQPTGKYIWYVRPWNSVDYGPWSSGLEFWTDAPLSPHAPAKPVLISPSLLDGAQSRPVTFEWEAVPDATYYYLYVNDPTGNVYEKWFKYDAAGCDPADPTPTVCTVTPADFDPPDGPYTWWVRAWRTDPDGQPGGLYGPWSDPMDFIIGIVPAAPSDLVATATLDTEIDLTWTDNSSDETGFSIERSPDGFAWTEIDTVGANVTAYTDSGLACETTYYYRVRTEKSGIYSTFSNTANATTLTCPAAPPNPPTALSVTTVSETQLDLSWTDNSSDELGFSIERSPDGSTWAEIDTVGVDITTYPDTGLSCGTTYYYRVRAFRGSAYSAYSNTANGTTTACPPPPFADIYVNVGDYTSSSCQSSVTWGGHTWQQNRTYGSGPWGLSSATWTAVLRTQGSWTTYDQFGAPLGSAGEKLFECRGYSGASIFTYAFDVIPGNYRILLGFADHFRSAGQRRFDVKLYTDVRPASSMALLLDDFDIALTAGGMDRAILMQYTFTINAGETRLYIDFIRGSGNIDNNAQIMAIGVEWIP